jgi:hypothetical protein
MPTYQEQIAQWRAQRKQQEVAERVNQIASEYRDAVRERDQHIANNDLESAAWRDADCEQLEQEYSQYVPPQQPQIDPRLVQFAKQNAGFLQKYGQRAYQALDAAHQYMMRPRTGNPNPAFTGMGWNPQHVYTPAYFARMKELLEMHGESHLGVKYDPNEEMLTPNEAAKISGLTPQQYNYAAQVVGRQGRYSWQNKDKG